MPTVNPERRSSSDLADHRGRLFYIARRRPGCRGGGARPSGCYFRPAAGILGFLPILGVWMLPTGLTLLANDVPLLRSWRSRVLDWIERRHPEWFDSGSRVDDPS